MSGYLIEQGNGDKKKKKKKRQAQSKVSRKAEREDDRVRAAGRQRVQLTDNFIDFDKFIQCGEKKAPAVF